jgi:oligosaccharide repeat unit polymerase
MQVVGYLLDGGQFYPFYAKTWSIVTAGLVGFFLGSKLVRVSAYAFPEAVAPPPTDGEISRLTQRFFRLAQALYVLATVYSLSRITAVLGVDAILSGDFAALRLAIINDFVGDRELFSWIRVFYFGVGLAVFQLAHAHLFSTAELTAVAVLGLLSAIATTGRLYLLLFVLALGFLLYRQRKISLRGVVAVFCGFIVLFFLLALLLQKGGDEGSVLEQLAWNARVYLLSSLACFNDFVWNDSSLSSDGVLIPNSVRSMLRVAGIVLEEKPNLLPFAQVPVKCNTYTALFPLYHDLGIIGVLLGFMGVGWLTQFFWEYERRSRSSMSMFLYSVALYPLVMSMFEDAYFSSPGFWVTLWIPPLALFLAQRLYVELRSPRRLRTYRPRDT